LLVSGCRRMSCLPRCLLLASRQSSGYWRASCNARLCPVLAKHQRLASLNHAQHSRRANVAPKPNSPSTMPTATRITRHTQHQSVTNSHYVGRPAGLKPRDSPQNCHSKHVLSPYAIGIDLLFSQRLDLGEAGRRLYRKPGSSQRPEQDTHRFPHLAYVLCHREPSRTPARCTCPSTRPSS
jgi:hypothetical protein